MSLTDDNNMVMPVAPAYGNGGNNMGDCFGGNWAWIILLLLLGWGNNGWNNGNNGNGGSNLGSLYPWMNQADVTQSGFRDMSTQNMLTGIQSGVNGLSTQLCNCCFDMREGMSNGFAQMESSANNRQMANMNQAFTAQTAMNNGFNQVSAQLANASADNRLGIANLDAAITRENCADREALNYSTRDIIANQESGFRMILDQMSKDKIDAKNEKIAELQNQLTMANLAASNTAQNAFIAQTVTGAIDANYQRFKDCPVPTMPVYGNQPVFTCGQNSCGCGCGA
jgi:hypothetical protein